VFGLGEILGSDDPLLGHQMELPKHLPPLLWLVLLLQAQ
jgi:hypothetical protein